MLTLIKNLFKNNSVTVQQIHNEIDQAQEKCLEEAQQLLASLNITTESSIERKAIMLKELGFINNETVKNYEKFAESQKQVEHIHYLRNKYPFQKFITL